MARIKYWDEASQSWKYADKSLKIDNNFLIDKDLIIEGRAADAKATGDAIIAARTHAEEVANEAASNVKNDLLNGAGAAYDTLKEVGALIEENKEAIEALEAIVKGTDLTGYATEEWVQEGFQPKGEYLTEVPTGYAKTEDIPTKVSQLTNDSGYLTQHQDISGKLDADKLPEAINDALAQAKASGEFDGEDGHTPVKGEDYYTEADKAEIVEITKSSITPAGIGAAPQSHASSANTYGLGNGTNYGHVKLSDEIAATSNVNAGVAATPYAVKQAYARAATLMNRTTNVNAADTNYTTLMTRGISLNSAETTPTVNGAIAWTYE